jgi:hypothetical protein
MNTSTRYLMPEDLQTFGFSGTDTAAMAKALIAHQTSTWPMLRNGASSLDSVQVRQIDFGSFSMKVQFNPGRIVSSAAKVDQKSIAERKCFLCEANLPAEQKGIETGDYVILCNPFPIFPEHFTIPHKQHIPQQIPRAFQAMLGLTRELGSRYSLFYNGPKCGASAPDHLHFQAGDFGFMTIDHTWQHLVKHHGAWIHQSGDGRIAKVDDGLRRFIVTESPDMSWTEQQFARIFEAFSTHNPTPEEEPMLNILTAYTENRWRVIIFLRKRHRPDQFFLEGNDKIVFSPASVDFGGVCITPVEKDFHLMDKVLLTNMFGQLSVGKDVLNDVAGALQK